MSDSKIPIRRVRVSGEALGQRWRPSINRNIYLLLRAVRVIDDYNLYRTYRYERSCVKKTPIFTDIYLASVEAIQDEMGKPSVNILVDSVILTNPYFLRSNGTSHLGIF